MTEIFKDGFELAFTPWTVVGTPIIVTSPVHHGSNAMQINSSEWVLKSFVSSSLIYARIYIQFARDIGDSSDDRTVFVRLRNSVTGDICDVGRYNDAGTKKWRLRVLESGSIPTSTAFSTTPAFVTNQWYCIEVMAKINATQGEYHVWFDGVENVDFRRLNKVTDARGNIDQILLGLPAVTGLTPTLYYDCFVLADAYIGPEGVPAPVLNVSSNPELNVPVYVDDGLGGPLVFIGNTPILGYAVVAGRTYRVQVEPEVTR